MNKSGLVAEVAKRVDRNKADVARTLDAAMAVIRDTVARGERVALVGFGTFDRQRRNKRVARNPRRPDVPITVPARDVPAFSPGQAFRQAVQGKRRRTPAKTAAGRARAAAASAKRSTGRSKQR
ncbi:MAG: HU family DNA-binding protein [Actinomycetota bacterium]|nr:HU family DNA-binding protein [Actinomycetota bacterium]